MESEAREAGRRLRGRWRRTGLEEAQPEGECRTDSQEVQYLSGDRGSEESLNLLTERRLMEDVESWRRAREEGGRAGVLP